MYIWDVIFQGLGGNKFRTSAPLYYMYKAPLDVHVHTCT